MGHWVFWEWVAYASLWVAAVIVAINGVALLPIAFLLAGTVILVGHELGFYGKSDSPAPPQSDIAAKPDENSAVLTKIALLEDRFRLVEAITGNFQQSCFVQLAQMSVTGYDHKIISLFEEMAKATENLVNTALGETISFREHPTYDRMPEKPAPGEPSLPPAVVADYRKVYDQCETAKITVGLVKGRYEQRRREYTRELK
jgi:hypothetical protein